MANVCTYNLSVVGPREDIAAISELLLPALAIVPQSVYGHVFLDFDQLPSLGDVTHNWIGLGWWINSDGKLLDWEKTQLPTMLFGADGKKLATPPQGVVCVWKNVRSYHDVNADTLDADTLATLDTLGIRELLDLPAYMTEMERLMAVAKTLGIEEEVSRRWQAKGRLEIGGDAKWGPPTPFAQALSALYPNVGIRVSGTTEHEAHDDYIFVNGDCYPITVMSENIQTGEMWWEVREGVEYNPPEHESNPDYDCYWDEPMEPEHAGI
jgi:hypothetical protein